MAKSWILVRSYHRDDTHWYVLIRNVNWFWLSIDHIFNSDFAGRLCCGKYTWRIFQYPFHWMMHKTMTRTWVGEQLRVTDEIALKLDSKWVAEVLQREQEDAETEAIEKGDAETLEEENELQEMES